MGLERVLRSLCSAKDVSRKPLSARGAGKSCSLRLDRPNFGRRDVASDFSSGLEPNPLPVLPCMLLGELGRRFEVEARPKVREELRSGKL
jgi:hypothetical protein